MQIKDLAHVKELMEQGVLVPNKTLVKHKVEIHSRIFIFANDYGFYTTGLTTADALSIWHQSIFNGHFTIVKPKKKVKLECWVGFFEDGSSICEEKKEKLDHPRIIHIEHICKEIEVEDE